MRPGKHHHARHAAAGASLQASSNPANCLLHCKQAATHLPFCLLVHLLYRPCTCAAPAAVFAAAGVS